MRHKIEIPSPEKYKDRPWEQIHEVDVDGRFHHLAWGNLCTRPSSCWVHEHDGELKNCDWDDVMRIWVCSECGEFYSGRPWNNPTK
jgi:hypothetical protein